MYEDTLALAGVSAIGILLLVNENFSRRNNFILCKIALKDEKMSYSEFIFSGVLHWVGYWGIIVLVNFCWMLFVESGLGESVDPMAWQIVRMGLPVALATIISLTHKESLSSVTQNKISDALSMKTFLMYFFPLVIYFLTGTNLSLIMVVTGSIAWTFFCIEFYDKDKDIQLKISNLCLYIAMVQLVLLLYFSWRASGSDLLGLLLVVITFGLLGMPMEWLLNKIRNWCRGSKNKHKS